MKTYRTELHGHRVEVRLGEWGGQQVLLDGRLIAHRPFAGWSHRSFFFEIHDTAGAMRTVEVQRIDVSRLGLGKYRIQINVDGVERCRLEPIDPRQAPNTCANCGYQLNGLPVENGEIRCPECGRHTNAARLGG